jgi:carbamate kinase
VLVVCVGGGGIPVGVDRDGRLHGVEAVIDKDLAAALLARGLDADALLMLTDVAAVQAGWGTDEAYELSDVSVEAMRAMRFAAGSMGPKVEAACRFAEATEGVAGIGALAEARDILEGRRGTRITAAVAATAR